MSVNIAKHIPLLKFLAKASKRYINLLLSHPETSLVSAFAEICNNIINGNVPLRGSERFRVKKLKQILIAIGSKRKFPLTKKKLILKKYALKLTAAIIPPALRLFEKYLKQDD